MLIYWHAPGQGTDGNFYGTTAGNGMSLNTIFKMTQGGAVTTLHTFNGPDGFTPLSTLVEGPTGLLYGTDEYGVNSACYGGCGTVFSVSAVYTSVLRSRVARALARPRP